MASLLLNLGFTRRRVTTLYAAAAATEEGSASRPTPGAWRRRIQTLCAELGRSSSKEDQAAQRAHGRQGPSGQQEQREETRQAGHGGRGSARGAPSLEGTELPTRGSPKRRRELAAIDLELAAFVAGAQLG